MNQSLIQWAKTIYFPAIKCHGGNCPRHRLRRKHRLSVSTVREIGRKTPTFLFFSVVNTLRYIVYQYLLLGSDAPTTTLHGSGEHRDV